MHHTNTVGRSVIAGGTPWSPRRVVSLPLVRGAAKLPDNFDLDFDKNTGVQRPLQMAKVAAIFPGK